MLNLVKPRYVMPFHGDYKRLRLHAAARRGGRHRPERHLPGRQRPAAGASTSAARASASPSRPGMIFVDGVEIGDMADVGAARPAHALRRRHLHRRRHDRRAGRQLGRRPRGHLPRRAVPRPGRRAGRGDPRHGRGLARARRRARACARSTCCSRCCTTTWRSSSTTACGAGRWSCRSSSRSEAAGRRTTKRAPLPCRRASRMVEHRAAVGLRSRRHDREPEAE